MDKRLITEKLAVIAKEAADKNKLEFVRAEMVGSTKEPIIRIFIDKPVGITHEDCTQVSREIAAILDVADYVPLTYILEVSSPGLERELYSIDDFVKFHGSLAKVKLRIPINGQKNLSGRIEAVEDAEIVFFDKTNGKVKFPFEAVAKANLEIDLEEEFKNNEKRKKENETPND